MLNVTIGITTFSARYYFYFKPLIYQLLNIFKFEQIIVGINGNINEIEQRRFLNKIIRFLNKKGIEFFFYVKPEGLATIWNEIICRSKTTNVLIINDDLILKSSFYKDIARIIEKDTELTTINSSFSHFLLRKSILTKVGWFDERLIEIGGEDDDYRVRCYLEGINLDNIVTNSVQNFSHKLKKNSYGFNMIQSKQYSEKNNHFLFNVKWEVSDSYFKGAIEIPTHRIKYWKLRDDCETPHFYKK